MKKICYIVGAGEGFVPFSPKENDFVIAADGGYDALRRAGVRPHLFVGDMDSFAGTPDGETECHPVRKDDTDTALAYRAGRARGYENFVLLSCVGGREAHTYANLSLLAAARREGARVLLVGKKETSLVMENESITLSRPAGTLLSVFAFGGAAHGVTLRNLSYPAEGLTLLPDVPLGVSNAFCDAPATVSVGEGRLLLMCGREDGEIPLDIFDGFCERT